MTDLVERLRARYSDEERKVGLQEPLLDEAAAEIERLRNQWPQAEIALRDAELYRLRDEIERLRVELGKTERDLERTLAALDHHLKAGR